MRVPFLDLGAQYRSIKADVDRAIQDVLDSCAFAGGPFVEKFEREWAGYCGVREAVGVASGTDALWLTLMAMGIGQGDEVITVPNTFVATAEAISLSGATPVFVDIDEKYYTMNPNRLGAAVTPRTKAIIPVHLFGQMCDMDPIMGFAEEHGLLVIEDACQAHGASYKGRKAGSIGDAGAFSFYPGKNLGAYGEAGAIATSSETLAIKVRMLRDHGQSRKYQHEGFGWNARMDGIQGAVLSAKLRHLDEWTASRRECARRYEDLLGQMRDVVPPEEREDCRHVYHLFVIRTAQRDAIESDLRERGIGTGIHYPVAIHLQREYRNSPRGELPVAERYQSEVLSLPMFAELDSARVEYVCDSLARALSSVGRLQGENPKRD